MNVANGKTFQWSNHDYSCLSDRGLWRLYVHRNYRLEQLRREIDRLDRLDRSAYSSSDYAQDQINALKTKRYDVNKQVWSLLDERERRKKNAAMSER